ncbi:MAG: DUF3332 family protein [Nitrospirae bacterium]|nr:MAG: hypothetical protein AUI03_03765 [Nitrospirae bacterium 13_2_20CM_2_62_8]TLY40152.1 MAG: DUF3332 family protein [Nitrospirota bacterium]
MSVRKWIRIALVAATLVSFLSMTSACYGPFNLTRNLYKWNSQLKGTKEIGAKWMRGLVFPLLIPFYLLAAVGDAVVFNFIEFWGGTNPVRSAQEGEDGRTRIVRAGDRTMTLTFAEDGNSAHVTYAKAGEVYKKAEIIRTGSGYQLLDEKGVPLYSAELSNGGGINLLDRDCQLVHAVSPEQLNIAASRLATLEAETN